MIDTQLALEAREAFGWIADRWPDLTAALAPGGGKALTGMPRGASSALPINVHVSDLMREIDDQAWGFCRALVGETDDVQGVPATPVERLRLVASRYGHFVAADDRTALEYCDVAHDAREKVRRTLERPPAPTYLGPCPVADTGEGDACDGELYQRGATTRLRCPTCGHETTVDDQRAWIAERMDDRLMTASEIGRALKVAGHDVPHGTVRRWCSEGRLADVGDGLYRFTDALDMAQARRAKAV